MKEWTERCKLNLDYERGILALRRTVKCLGYANGDNEKISSILSVTPRIVNDWTEEERKDEKEKRDQKILELYLQCYSFEEISKKLDISMGTVSNVFKKGNFSEIEGPEDLQLYNVWSVGPLDKDQLLYSNKRANPRANRQTQ